MKIVLRACNSLTSIAVVTYGGFSSLEGGFGL